MSAPWFDELAEFLRIPSVSADSAHDADTAPGRPLGCRLHHRRRWDGGGRRLGGAAARDRRDRRHDRRRRGADGALLRPFRRSAARAARAVGERAVRAGDPWGVPVRARDGRRQGTALHVAVGGARARGCRRAAGERPVLLRRRGGDRRPLDRRLPRRGRAWGGRGDHLRQRHDPARAAGVQPGDARARLLPPEAADRRRRPALGRVRRRRAECCARAVGADLPADREGRPARRSRSGAGRYRPTTRSSRAGPSCRRAPTSSPSRARARWIRARPRSSTCGRSPSPRST